MLASHEVKLREIPGIGNTLAAKLVRRGITSKAQLRTIIDELPQETQAHLRHNVTRSIPYPIASAIVDELKTRLTFAGPTGRRRRYPIIAVGGVRRHSPLSKDLDVLVVVPNERMIRGLLASAELSPRRAKKPNTLALAESYATGNRRRSFIVRRGVVRPKYYAVDLFLATEQEKPYALFHFTGGRDYNIRVRAHAKRSGYVLNQYGLFCATAPKGHKRRRVPGTRAIGTERDLMQFLGVTYRPPKDRTEA